MLNQEVDDITRQLKDIRLERARAVKRLEEINETETNLLKNLHRAKAKNQGTCPFAKGDIVAITNHLRNEFGIVWKIEKIGVRLVNIVNSSTNKTYSRAWWNLRLIESAVTTTSPPPSRK